MVQRENIHDTRASVPYSLPVYLSKTLRYHILLRTLSADGRVDLVLDNLRCLHG